MISDHFAALVTVIQSDYAAKHAHQSELIKMLSQRLLTPFLPSTVRHGPGFVLDIFERQAGPFDVVAASDFWPPIGEGEASFYLADGVIFCLSARNWAAHDLTEFALKAKEAKALKRKTPVPILCIAFSYTPLEGSEVVEFMKSSAGSSIDAVFSLGKNLVIRNNLGWYGDSQSIPFVSELNTGQAMKFFAFYLLHAVHVAAGVPFGWADYQHL